MVSHAHGANAIQPVITPPPHVALAVPDHDNVSSTTRELDSIDALSRIENTLFNQDQDIAAISPRPAEAPNTSSSEVSTVAATTMSFPRALPRPSPGRRYPRRVHNTSTAATANTGSATTTATSTVRVGRLLPSLGDRLSMMYIVSVVSSTVAILAVHPQQAAPDCTRIRAWLWVNAVLTLLRGLGKLARLALNRARHFNTSNFNRSGRAAIWLAHAVRVLTFIALAWFLVGLVFVLIHDKSKHACNPHVWALALALVVIEMTLLFLSLLLGLLIFLFAPNPAANSLAGLGLSDDNIEKLKKFEYNPEKHGARRIHDNNNNNDNNKSKGDDHQNGDGVDNNNTDNDNNDNNNNATNGVDKDGNNSNSNNNCNNAPCEHPVCAICLSEYEPGDIIRELPCSAGHRFHAKCVDVWLVQVASCPVCREDFLYKLISDGPHFGDNNINNSDGNTINNDTTDQNNTNNNNPGIARAASNASVVVDVAG